MHCGWLHLPRPARPPPGRRDSHVSKPSRGAYPRRALRSCPSTSAARSRGTAMVARRACGSWPAVCVTGAAPTDAPTTSARTAGRAACPGASRVRRSPLRPGPPPPERPPPRMRRPRYCPFVGSQALPMLIQSSLVMQMNTLRFQPGLSSGPRCDSALYLRAAGRHGPPWSWR